MFEELLRLGSLKRGKRYALYTKDTEGVERIRVQMQGYPYTTEQVSAWATIHWETYRPWYAPWVEKRRCIGFSVLCPRARVPERGKTLVLIVLDRLSKNNPDALGKYRKLFYWIARGLNVTIPYVKIPGR